jgi:peptidoglycan/LPS O-acetylase OafA/YrhL
MTAPAPYRGDIDGLRAIAVLSVLAFHYGFPPRGGFVGVDVFFVISGYLITGILFREIEDGTFSIRGFYERRIRRIVPALLAMLLVVCVIASAFQFPGDYVDTAWSAVFAAFGASNFYFHANTGYFDQSAEFMPLLHTWSLGVEEQFYVVWPALLAAIAWACHRKDRIAFAIAALAALSFAASLVTLSTAPKTAFYFPHTRAWELALGALMVFLPPLRRMPGELANAAGLVLIAAGLFLISERDPFPGWNALLPCAGSALILWAKPATLSGRGLAALRGIGLISYSLYLWHWPLWVFYRLYLNNGVPSALEALLIAAAALVISTLSYVAIEQPFRRLRRGQLVTIGTGIASACAVALLAFGVVSMQGFPGRIPDRLLGLRSLDVMWSFNGCRAASVNYQTISGCEFGADWKSARLKGVLWGDSHAGHFAPILEPFAKDADASLILYQTCPAFIDGDEVSVYLPRNPEYSRNCGASRAAILRMLDEHPDVKLVVLAAAWTYQPETLFHLDPQQRSRESGMKLFEDTLERTIERISSPGRHIVLIGTVPQWNASPVPCELAGGPVFRAPCTPPGFTREYETNLLGPANAVFRRIAERHSNVAAILPAEAMCTSAVCTSHLDGELLYRDTSHIRRNLPEQTRRQLGKLLQIDRLVFDRQQVAR